MAVGLSALLIGLLCDNFNTRKLFLVLCVCGFTGLMLSSVSSLGFGILFGASVSMVRCGSFSSPMKLFPDALSWSVVWQSISKSLSTFVIPLFVLGTSTFIGWDFTISILAFVYLCVGLLIYKMMPDDVMTKYDLREVGKWVKSWKVWLTFIALSSTSLYMIFMSRMVPTLTSQGYTIEDAMFLVLVLGFIEIVGRFPAAWIADKFDSYIIPFAVIRLSDAVFLWFVLPYSPILAIVLHFTFQSASTPTMWPAITRSVGPQYVSTFYGLCAFAGYVAITFLF